MLTPLATKTGKVLADRLFNDQPELKMNFDIIPTVMFTHPPIGSIGLTEEMAKEKYGEDGYRVHKDRTMDFHFSLRATPEEKFATFCKLIVRNSDDRVVGFHSIGAGSPEMTQGFAVAM
jgi:glutathione reductase (NADPH)